MFTFNVFHIVKPFLGHNFLIVIENMNLLKQSKGKIHYILISYGEFCCKRTLILIDFSDILELNYRFFIC